MKQHAKAEVDVLERFLHMLGEGSVTYLAEQDSSFGHFVEKLYGKVDDRAAKLRRSSRVSA